MVHLRLTCAVVLVGIQHLSFIIQNHIILGHGILGPSPERGELFSVTENSSIESNAFNVSQDNEGHASLSSNYSNYMFISEVMSFIEVHLFYCEHIPLCTLKANYYFSNDVNCCRECSCTEDCIDNDNCCPDFWLKSALNRNSSFETLQDLDDYLNDLNEVEIADVKSVVEEGVSVDDMINSTSVVLKSNADQETCTRARIGEEVTRKAFQGKAYPMMTHCSSLVPFVVYERCEESPENTDVLDLVPVTTINDKKTFKNQHCFRCSNYSLEMTEEWEVYVVCTAAVSYLFKYGVVTSLFSKKTKSLYCRIHFRPGAKMSQYVKTCRKYDINSCEGDVVSPLLNYVCRNSTSPVDILEGNKKLVSKNLACYLCSKDGAYTDMRKCTKSFTDESEVMINTTVIGHASSSDNGVLKKSFHRMCDTGFAFDSYKNTCRRVICPEWFKLVDGQCQLLYTYTKNVVFGLKILVTMETRFRSMKIAEQMRNINEIYQRSMTRVQEQIAMASNVSIWQRSPVMKEYAVSLFIYMTFIPQNMTFEEILHQTFSFRDEIIKMDVISNIKFTSRFDATHNFKTGTILDMETQDMYFKQVPEAITHKRPDVVITDSALCPKVSLTTDEIIVLNKHVYSLIYADVKLYYSDVATHYGRSKAYFICYKYLQVDIPSDITRRSDLENSDKTVADVEKPLTKPFAITIFIAVIIFALAGFRVFKCIRKNVSNSIEH